MTIGISTRTRKITLYRHGHRVGAIYRFRGRYCIRGKFSIQPGDVTRLDANDGGVQWRVMGEPNNSGEFRSPGFDEKPPIWGL